MEIDKNQIVEFLKSKGQHDKADQAQKELPDTIDPQRDEGVLATFGIDPSELMGNLGGGGLGKMFGG